MTLCFPYPDVDATANGTQAAYRPGGDNFVSSSSPVKPHALQDEARAAHKKSNATGTKQQAAFLPDGTTLSHLELSQDSRFMRRASKDRNGMVAVGMAASADIIQAPGGHSSDAQPLIGDQGLEREVESFAGDAEDEDPVGNITELLEGEDEDELDGAAEAGCKFWRTAACNPTGVKEVWTGCHYKPKWGW